MPMERERYPAEWERIAFEKKEAVGWKCERCGKQCRKPGEPFDTHRNTLTVAHLNHTPEDVRPENLCAMCARAICGMTRSTTRKQEEGGLTMDLISKKSAVSRISDLLVLELKGKRIPTWNEVYNAIGDIPSVPAVPIKAISEWLAGYAAPPKYALDAITNGIDPASIAYTANDRAKAWELHLKTLIESGLMEAGDVKAD